MLSKALCYAAILVFRHISLHKLFVQCCLLWCQLLRVTKCHIITFTELQFVFSTKTLTLKCNKICLRLFSKANRVLTESLKIKGVLSHCWATAMDFIWMLLNWSLIQLIDHFHVGVLVNIFIQVYTDKISSEWHGICKDLWDIRKKSIVWRFWRYHSGH